MPFRLLHPRDLIFIHFRSATVCLFCSVSKCDLCNIQLVICADILGLSPVHSYQLTLIHSFVEITQMGT